MSSRKEPKQTPNETNMVMKSERATLCGDILICFHFTAKEQTEWKGEKVVRMVERYVVNAKGRVMYL